MRNAWALLGETNCLLLLNHCQQEYRPFLIMLSLSAFHLSAPSECWDITKMVTEVAMNDIPRNVRHTSRTNPQLYQLDAQHSDGLLSSFLSVLSGAFSYKGSEGLPEKCLAALTHGVGMSALSLFPPLSISFHPSLPLPPASLLSFFKRGQSSAC